MNSESTLVATCGLLLTAILLRTLTLAVLALLLGRSDGEEALTTKEGGGTDSEGGEDALVPRLDSAAVLVAEEASRTNEGDVNSREDGDPADRTAREAVPLVAEDLRGLADAVRHAGQRRTYDLPAFFARSSISSASLCTKSETLLAALRDSSASFSAVFSAFSAAALASCWTLFTA